MDLTLTAVLRVIDGDIRLAGQQRLLIIGEM